MKNLTKKIGIALILIIIAVLLGFRTTKVNAATFTDIPSSAWYKDEVEYVAKHGLMNGTGSGKFSPDKTVTRAMLVTIVWRLEKGPIVTNKASFNDINQNEYYGKAVNWAAGEGIVTGVTKTKFAPNDPVTREQAATIIGRYLKKYFPDLDINATKFKDDGAIMSYAKEHVYFLRTLGIMQGDEKNYFNPKNGLKRSELACLAYNIAEMLNKKLNYNVITATVTANSGVNVREKTNTNSKIIKGISKGDKVDILIDEHGWAKLRYDSGYIYSMNLSYGDESADAKFYNNVGIVDVQSDSLILRQKPSLNANILMYLEKGRIVKAGEPQGDWVPVKVGRIYGYVWASYLKINGTTDTTGWQRISTVTTYNTGTSDESKFNADLASKILTGITISSGNTFSWCTTMGECSREKGFLESTTFVDNESVKSYGGGICQVSTTINMAIKKLQIATNAEQHSKRVAYATEKDEATVYYNTVDFSFTNTKSKDLKLIVTAENGVCTCEVWQKY